MNNLQDEISRLDQEITKNRNLLGDPELASLAEEEILRLEDQKSILEKAITSQQSTINNQQLTISSILDRAATMEVRAGTGGDEAKIWAEDLARMYLKFCEQIGLKTTIIDDGVIKISGIYRGVSLTYAKETPHYGPYGLLRFESGVHRVQRVPQTEVHGRIHTSTASVAVLPEVAVNEVSVNDNDLEWAFSRAGGPGGQNVNKRETAVRIVHVPSGIAVHSSEERSQEQNREQALAILRAKIFKKAEEEKKSVEDSMKLKNTDIEWGNQIRSFVLHPYKMVKDHRTGAETSNTEAVLNGGLDIFIEAEKNL